MIVIDGQQTNLQVNSFGNLEEILVKVMEDQRLDNKIITDVLVNDENFSEIYPHQAEDIASGDIRSVEIISVPKAQMALNITQELGKVVTILSRGAREIADLFRQADDGEALEMYQDFLEVARNFLSMISLLRDEFHLREEGGFGEAVMEMSDLFTEMMDVMENGDWILLSDLLEYEFLPVVDRWRGVIDNLLDQIGAKAA